MTRSTRILAILSIVLLTAVLFISIEDVDVSDADDTIVNEGPLYDLLSDDQKKVYDKLYYVVLDLGESCDASSLTMDEALDLMKVFSADNPQFFWFDEYYRCYYDSHKHPTSIKAEDLDRDAILRMCDEIDENRSEYVFTGTDLEKIRQIHDYLDRTIWYEENEYDQTLYSALVLKKTVCAGYASAFSYLCKLNGIDAVKIMGNVYMASGLEYHAWNYVALEGRWYAMDLTWDDSKCPEDFCYDYFLIGLETVVDGDRFIDVRKPDYDFGIPVESERYDGDISGYTSGVISWAVGEATVKERVHYKDALYLELDYAEIQLLPDTWPALYSVMERDGYFSIAFKPTGTIEFENGKSAHIYRINAYLDDVLIDPSDLGLEECILIYITDEGSIGCAQYDFYGDVISVGFFGLDHSGSYFIGDAPFIFDIIYIVLGAVLVFLLILLAVILLGRRHEVKKRKPISPGLKCPKCGAPILKDDEFCMRCGTNLKAEDSSEPPNDDQEQL